MSKSAPAYLLSLALVGSLGLNAIQAGVIGTAHAATESCQIVEADPVVYLPAVAGPKTLAQLAADVCASVDSKLGLTGDDVCTIADVLHVVAHRNDDSNPNMIVVRGAAKICGSFVARAVP